MVPIIIPAHNEANVIHRCLSPLKEGLDSDFFEVIVVCNGCTDNTAQKVKEFSSKIKIIDTTVPSKANALNRGDKAASSFPRIYLDADVMISYEDLIKVIEVLKEDNSVLAASPKIIYKMDKSSLAVKIYYKVWTATPYFQKGTLGSGFYALSEEGRKRFQDFPSIISDDGFVRLQFDVTERLSVNDAKLYVYPPRDVKNLIKIKTRAYKGNRELLRLYPELNKNENKSKKDFLQVLLKRPGILLLSPVYLFIKGLIYLNISKTKENTPWERDKSSRMEESN